MKGTGSSGSGRGKILLDGKAQSFIEAAKSVRRRKSFLLAENHNLKSSMLEPMDPNYPAVLVLLALLALAACKPASETQRGTPAELSAIRSAGERPFSAGDVVTWAQLDDTFLDRSAKLEVGAADGKTVLGRLVILENGTEAAAFLIAHGCVTISGPIGVRKLTTALEVDVEITSKDGQKLILILKSDGTPQGVG